MWAPLLNGGRLAVAPPGELTPGELAAFVRDEAVTVAWFTAGLFHQILDTAPEALGGLRHLLAGGDVLSAPHVRKAAELLPAGAVINGYGPTENTTFTCCHPVGLPLEHETVPIGRPIRGTTAHVLDEHLRPVRPGEVGELHTGGLGLARGYVNDPDQTAERFIPDPFADRPGARMYRTGDLVRELPDGSLEFVGRVDAQVKIRGFRVEPGRRRPPCDGTPMSKPWLWWRRRPRTVHGSRPSTRATSSYRPPHCVGPCPKNCRRTSSRRSSPVWTRSPSPPTARWTGGPSRP